jgi:hypothetical protein
MEFVANNDALIAAFTFPISVVFYDKATITKRHGQKPPPRQTSVSIQSARLTGDGTDLAMDESVAFMHVTAQVDCKLQKTIDHAFRWYATTVNLPPIRWYTTTPLEAEDPKLPVE